VSRTFYHYQYLEWKDKRVPTATQTADVVKFIEEVDMQWRATGFDGPLVVHCR